MKQKTKPFGILLAAIFGLSLTLTLLWNLSHIPVVYAAGITVNTSADELDIDGDCSLREAIQAANLDTAVDDCTPGSGADEILFSLTTPAEILLTEGQIEINNDPLTISGLGADQLTISGNDESRIFEIADGIAVTLTNVTLRDGYTENSGGAVRSGGALTVIDAAFIDNFASADGGAIDTDGDLTLQNSDLLSNTAQGEGGGVNAFGTLTSVTNGRFVNNQSGSYGGALYVNDALTIDGATFVSNTAQSFAGAVWAWDGATVANATFERNRAQNVSAGAMYVRYDLTLTATTFLSNTAAQNVGAVLANRDATIVNTTFTANEAEAGRSAALQVNDSLWLTNTQWIDNQATEPGGAVVHLGEDGRFVNSLFARNRGGAAALEQSGDVTIVYNTFVGPDTSANPALAVDALGSVSVQNSIFSGYLAGIDVTSGIVSEDYNLFHETTAVSGVVSRGEHSYSGDAAFVDAAGGDYHLSAHSEALNTGLDVGIDADLDGDARPGGSGIDLGYDETAHAADVSITKAAFSSPGPSQPITYTLTFANEGTAMLPRLTITDRLPVQVVAPIVISSSVPITDVGGDQPYVWQVHNLAPGASEVITVSGVLSEVLPHGLITNTVSIDTIATEADVTNNTDDAAITVPNVGPVAVDDTVTIAEDETAVFYPTLNDIDGDVLFIDSFAQPEHGTAVLSGTQQIVYTPTLEYNGPDSFTYTVSDGQSSDSATMTITVTAVNDAPVISNGPLITLTMSEDGDPTPFALTLNASDVENTPLSWSVTAQPEHGAAEAAVGPANSSAITYTPTVNYYGADQFQVQVSDGVLSDSVTIDVTIEAVNDAPVAEADAAVVLRQPSGDLKVLATGSTGMLNVLDNDMDVENQALTVIDVGDPDQGGAVSLDNDGSLQSYTPANDFIGTETYTYTVADGALADTAVVSMNVTNGLDGGIGGDAFTLPHIGLDNAFTVVAGIPIGVADGENFALVFDLPDTDHASAAGVSPADAPTGFEPAGLSFYLFAYLDGQLAAEDYRFNEPVTLTFSYPQADIADIGPSEQSLAPYLWNGTGWDESGIQIVERDTTKHRLVVAVDRPGTFSLFRRSFLFLPMVMNNYIQAPDLIVESVTVLSSGGAKGTVGDVQVIIKNVGNGSVLNEFWVDVYIDPRTPPTAVNQTWNMLGEQGLVWGVREDVLPLNPGETLTLTLASSYYESDLSHVDWPLAAGAELYAQVDSNNTETDTGAVLEMHEITGAPYNNISGP